ncbi:MAG: argininosuccinate lyase [Actinomycetota bacterium]
MSEPLWKGRFSKPPASGLIQFSTSLHFDQRLWPQDVAATRAHAHSLQRAGLLTAAETDKIEGALNEAAVALSKGEFDFDPADEDIHSAIERYLTSKLGELGAKIHAGRSRNDLVATDLRLWVKETILEIGQLIFDLEDSLIGQAHKHKNSLAPGYTHLQRAQPVLFAHHLLAHLFAIARDFDRMMGAHFRADMSCLGAAAFAGTTLPLDPKATAEDLGFSRVFDNSADAVADRDFALEFLSASAILAVHLSRLGEEIALWTTSEFGFATLDDSHATGSSIMPQKKNPDVAELARAKSARVTADLVHLLGVLKGLPLAYNRDLQEDKEPVFDAADSVTGALVALSGAVKMMSFDKERMEKATAGGLAGATDLAEQLVMQGVPFRTAHEAVGNLVAIATSQGKGLEDCSAAELAKAHPGLEMSMLRLLDARTSVNARNSHGGTAPERIEEQLAAFQNLMAEQKRWLGGNQAK